jgi:hypothetical protein
VEGSAPSEMEKETRMDVGALTTLGTFGHTDWRKMMVINLD